MFFAATCMPPGKSIPEAALTPSLRVLSEDYLLMTAMTYVRFQKTL
jgi:hypothetical protein